MSDRTTEEIMADIKAWDRKHWNDPGWRCDGKDCTVTGTYGEVATHIKDGGANSYNPPADEFDVSKVQCWGAVGPEPREKAK